MNISVCGDKSVITVRRKNGVLYTVVIDSEDTHILQQWTSMYMQQKNGYAVVYRPDGSNKGERKYLHALICPCPTGKVVDHIDRDKHNNRKENLRVVTQAENCTNRGLNKNNKSGVKGVSWFARDNLWEAGVKVNYKRVYIGRYKSIQEAEAAIISYKEDHGLS